MTYTQLLENTFIRESEDGYEIIHVQDLPTALDHSKTEKVPVVVQRADSYDSAINILFNYRNYQRQHCEILTA